MPSGYACPRAYILIPSPAKDFHMDHRLFAVLTIICFALGGAGCASESARENREEILMPRQTGSTFQRSVIVEKRALTKKKEKEEKKKEKKKEKEKSKEKESKRTSPKPTPAPEPEPSPKAVEETTPPPDRFR
jgi:hypothetical protein